MKITYRGWRGSLLDIWNLDWLVITLIDGTRINLTIVILFLIWSLL